MTESLMRLSMSRTILDFPPPFLKAIHSSTVLPSIRKYKDHFIINIKLIRSLCLRTKNDVDTWQMLVDGIFGPSRLMYTSFNQGFLDGCPSRVSCFVYRHLLVCWAYMRGMRYQTKLLQTNCSFCCCCSRVAVCLSGEQSKPGLPERLPQ